jgi:hypothetical protein
MVTVDSEGIRLTIDLHRFDATFAAALSGALAFGENRRAGRKRRAPAHAGAALGQAWRLAIDLGPLRSRARYAAMAEIAPRSRAGRCGSSRDSVRRSESVLLLASISPDRLERRQVNLSSELQLPEEKACVAIIRALVEAEVRFVLVGEVAEMNGGATPVADESGSKPVLELCYASTVANMRRLSAALRGLGARPHLPTHVSTGIAPGRDAEIFDTINTTTVDPVTLLSATALAFATPHGTICVRREVAGIGGFSAVRRRATCVRTYGRELAVLDLPAPAAARTASGTCGDIARLPVLETLTALPALEARRREFALRRTEHPVASPSTHHDSCPKTPRRPRSQALASTHGSPTH